MTNPSVLSLVEKDGMLQRLQDSEDDYVEGWSIRVFESKILLFLLKPKILTVKNHFTVNLHMDIIM